MDMVAHQQTIGEYTYKVMYDEDDSLDIDFENEEQKQEYFDKFARGELGSFGVITYTGCPCCKQLVKQDSLWGIHAEDAKQALKFYLEQL